MRGVSVFFQPVSVFFEYLSVFFNLPIRIFTYYSILVILTKKITSLRFNITKRGVSNDNPYFPFDTVIRLTARLNANSARLKSTYLSDFI